MRSARSCRHANAWIISGGTNGVSWCPDCGAIRKVESDESGEALVYSWRRWIYPKGQEAAVAALDRAEARR